MMRTARHRKPWSGRAAWPGAPWLSSAPSMAPEAAGVYVAGQLHTSQWEDAQTGERHAHVEIVLDDLILLDRRGGASGAATDDADGVPF